jgi:hypothetical protein
MTSDVIAGLAAEKYRFIQDYENGDILSRYMSDYDADEMAASEIFIEFKRFLAVSAACSSAGASTGMAGPVDDMWHTALLFTRDYRELCRSLGGFIDHEPDVSEHDSKESQEGYILFSELYELAFKQNMPSHIWPKIGAGTGANATCGAGQGGCSTGCRVIRFDANVNTAVLGQH